MSLVRKKLDLRESSLHFIASLDRNDCELFSFGGTRQACLLQRQI